MPMCACNVAALEPCRRLAGPAAWIARVCVVVFLIFVVIAFIRT